MGVEIKTGLEVISADLSSANQIQAVTCVRRDLTPVSIPCTKLLLATGPWTPTVYKSLFPTSPINLQWSTNAGDFIICKNPCRTTENTVAYVSFQAIVAEKMEFAARSDGTIWACGRRNHTASLPSPGEIAERDEQLIEELLGHARTWLNLKCSCENKHGKELKVVSKGRAFRPATESGLPVMSEVAPSDLSAECVKSDDNANVSSGVFVCLGPWILWTYFGNGLWEPDVSAHSGRGA